MAFGDGPSCLRNMVNLLVYRIETFFVEKKMKLSGVTQIAWWGYNISLYLVTLIGIVRNTPLWGTLPLPSWQ